MNTFLKSAVAAICLVGFVPAANATVTLANTGNGSSISPFGQPQSETYGQVFTAPVTGILSSFTLSLNGGVGDLYGAVGTWNGTAAHGFGFGSPVTLYKSGNVISSGPSSYTFSPNVAVTSGERYVAYLSVFGVPDVNSSTSMPQGTNAPGLDYFVWNNDSDPDGNSSWNYFVDIGDAKFSATFIAAVPEPSTWIMMIAGFGLIGGALRRQRSKVKVNYAFG